MTTDKRAGEALCLLEAQQWPGDYCLHCGATSPAAMTRYLGARLSKPRLWGPGQGEHKTNCPLVVLFAKYGLTLQQDE